jgi:hypothetical protein
MLPNVLRMEDFLHCLTTNPGKSKNFFLADLLSEAYFPLVHITFHYKPRCSVTCSLIVWSSFFLWAVHVENWLLLVIRYPCLTCFTWSFSSNRGWGLRAWEVWEDGFCGVWFQ